MNSKLKVAILSLDIAWADVEENLLNVEKCLKKLPGDADLVVLPELFSTGYIVDRNTLENIAETNNDKTMKRLLLLAETYSIAIAGSFIAREGTQLFNRAFFIEPSGESVFYDKKHLFSLSSEMTLFNAGKQSYPLLRYRGWNISMIICYDLRFPAWCRNKEQDYDLMLVPANWPEARVYAWEHLLIARAIENQAVFIGANRSGNDDFGCYQNMSRVFDSMGKPVVSDTEFSVSGTEVIVITLDKDAVDKCRSKLPFLKDADEFYFK